MDILPHRRIDDHLRGGRTIAPLLDELAALRRRRRFAEARGVRRLIRARRQQAQGREACHAG